MKSNNLSRLRLLVALMMLAAAGLACNLLELRATPIPMLTPTSPFGAPTVTISSPADGSEVARGQEVLIQSTSTDAVGVTRVELRVNGFIVNTVSAETTTGSRQFSVIQSWTPTDAGQAVLEIVAYRASVASAPARLTLAVRESAAQITATVIPPAGVTQAAPQDLTCRARVEVSGLNFRTGPNTNYPIIRILSLGSAPRITGRLGDNTWWQVQDSLDLGWISAGYASATGDCSQVPIAVPPPSPTPRPATETPTQLPTSTPIPGTATPMPTATASIPDLIISSISGPEVLQLNNTGTVGARYTVRVLNQGTGNSGQFITSFRHPDGTVTQLPIIVNLNPGQSADLAIDVTFTGSDAYRLEATVDSGLQVVESDEGNNIRTLNVVVTNPPT